MKKRLDFIDIAKFLGVIIVVFGHGLPAENPVLLALYSFHMPLFFVLNGMTLKVRDDDNFGTYLVRKMKAYLIPYAFFGIITIICEISINKWLGINVPNHFFLTTLVNLWEQKRLYTLWFLTALFLCDVLFYFCHFIGRKNPYFTAIPALIIFGFGLYCNKFVKIPYAWNLDVSLICIIFVYVGYLIMNGKLQLIPKIILSKRWVSAIAGTILLVGGLALGYANYKLYGLNLEMFGAQFSKYYFVIPSAILSSLGFIFLCKTIENKWLAVLGKPSITVFALHQVLPFRLFREWFKPYWERVCTLPNTDPAWYLESFAQVVFSAALLIGLYYAIKYSPLAPCINCKQPKYMQNLIEKVKNRFKKTSAEN